MQGTTWQVEGLSARLQSDALAASFDARRPFNGLQIERVGGIETPRASVFGVDWTTLFGADADRTTELFSRGKDLIATVSQTPSHPFRAQVYWRLLDDELSGGAGHGIGATVVAGLELVVSVQTGLLDSQPTLAVRTEAPASSARSLSVSGLPTELNLPAVVEDSAGPGCFAFPCDRGNGGGGSKITYVEMIHPADFMRAQLSRSEQGVTVEHTLFARRLEKGVILRSRLRGYWLTGAAVDERVADLYRQFAASEPPLTV